jgi:hypothetical protein
MEKTWERLKTVECCNAFNGGNVEVATVEVVHPEELLSGDFLIPMVEYLITDRLRKPLWT